MLRTAFASLCAPPQLRRAHARASCTVRVSATTYLAELHIKVRSASSFERSCGRRRSSRGPQCCVAAAASG